MTPPEVVSPSAPPDQPRSRRALLAGLIGGAGAWVAAAIGHPAATRAAAGDPLILGQTNSAGTAATRLNTSSSGGAFWMTQNGSGSGVRGESWHGAGGVFVTHARSRAGLEAQNLASTSGSGSAILAQTYAPYTYGVWAQQNGGGNAAAVRADGNLTNGVIAETNANGNYGVWATNSAAGIAIQGYAVSTGCGVRGTSPSGMGVNGSSGSYVGVAGYSDSNDGVQGVSTTGFGVHGLSTSSYAGYFDGPVYGKTHVDLAETATPTAPAANTARLFVRDSGGKTQLCVLFPTGAIQVLAIEP
jgi:hypothetical protein